MYKHFSTWLESVKRGKKKQKKQKKTRVRLFWSCLVHYLKNLCVLYNTLITADSAPCISYVNKEQKM